MEVLDMSFALTFSASSSYGSTQKKFFNDLCCSMPAVSGSGIPAANELCSTQQVYVWQYFMQGNVVWCQALGQLLHE